jgi:hypothetical protein
MITKLKTLILIASLWGGAVRVNADKLEQHYALLNNLFAEPALNKNNLKSELEGIIQDNNVGFFADYEETKIITLLTKPLISSGQLWFLSSSQVIKVQLKPFVIYTKISNNTIVQLDDLGKKDIISVSRYGALKAFTSAFIGLFSGDIDKLNKHYTIHKKKEPRMWRVGLKPKDKTIRELLKGIIVSGSSRSPETVQIFHSSGDLTSLKITNRRSINESEERKLILDLRFEQ